MSDEAVEANAVLTFEDENGQRWMCGTYLGDLVREKAPEERSLPEATMPVAEMIDHAMVLVDFKVVRRSP